MRRSKILSTMAVAAVLAVLLSLAMTEAQPGRMGGQAMGGGMSLEHTLAFLAFDESVALKDDQLIALRAGLKDLYAEQQEMIADMRQNRGNMDFEVVREQMAAMEEDLKETLGKVLDEDQAAVLDKHMQELQAARGGWGGGRGGQRR